MGGRDIEHCEALKRTAEFAAVLNDTMRYPSCKYNTSDHLSE
jgi:hypothetical protein